MPSSSHLSCHFCSNSCGSYLVCLVFATANVRLQNQKPPIQSGRRAIRGTTRIANRHHPEGSDGGAEGIRTPDLLNAIETRSQLRHSPRVSGPPKLAAHSSTVSGAPDAAPERVQSVCRLPPSRLAAG